MKIADLHSFVIVTETGSFKQAAPRLFRTPAAIAASIRRLERQASQRLLLPGTEGRLEPTPGGRVLLDHARRLIEAQQHTVTALARLPDGAPPPWRATLNDVVDDVIREAESSPVYDLACITPLDAAPLLAERLGHRVCLKREDRQVGFSFKIRGAYHRMARLTAEERRRGVVAASAGNHALGVALAARDLGVDAWIVMPTSTPRIKVAAVARLGVRVELIGLDFNEACEHAQVLCADTNATFIHPFDDLQVIAGQATVGLELAAQMEPGRSHVFVPVGGGGLVAAVGAVLKQRRRDVRIIGVEPVGAAGLSLSLERQCVTRLERVDTFAEGVAVREVGRHTLGIARHVVDEMVSVTNDAICAAIRDAYEECRAILEPAGAVALAGAIQRAATLPVGDTIIAILSGANMDFERLPLVLSSVLDVNISSDSATVR